MVILALGQFLFFHEQHIAKYGDSIINLLNHELTVQNTSAIEASILALNTLCSYSSATFSLIISKIIALPIPQEGDMSCILYLMEFVKKYASLNGSSVLTELLQKYSPIIKERKFTIKARILALDLCAEFSTFSDNFSEMNSTLDAAKLLLDEVTDEDTRRKIYIIINRGFEFEREEEHYLNGLLLDLAKKDLRSKEAKKRDHALELFKIFNKKWEFSDRITFLMRLLADSDVKAFLLWLKVDPRKNERHPDKQTII